jgi:hypothetical protein
MVLEEPWAEKLVKYFVGFFEEGQFPSGIS